MPNAEPRWPAALAVVAVAGLFYSLPEPLTLGPNWLTLVLILVALGLTVASYLTGRHAVNRVFGLAVLVLITGALFWSLGTLIAGLPGNRQPPVQLLRSAASLWISNVLVFASWYWRLDAGGPHARDARDRHEDGAILFPQMTLRERSPSLEAGVCRLFVLGLQHQHGILAD